MSILSCRILDVTGTSAFSLIEIEINRNKSFYWKHKTERDAEKYGWITDGLESHVSGDE